MSNFKFNPIPTRFYKGVTNVAAHHPLAFYSQPDPATWHSYFNDWSYYQSNQWTVNNVGSPTIGLVSGDGGVLSIATGATTGNSTQFTGTAPGYLPEANRMIIARMRFSLSDVVNSAFQFGLVNAAPTVLAPTDGFYFSKADQSAVLVANSAASSVVTSLNATTLVNSTYVDVALVTDCTSAVWVFVNQIMVGTLTPAAFPSVILTRDWEVKTTSNAAVTMLEDYVFFAKSRKLQGSSTGINVFAPR